jgi:hypothetical protein
MSDSNKAKDVAAKLEEDAVKHVRLIVALEILARAEEGVAEASVSLGFADDADEMYKRAKAHYAKAIQETRYVAQKREMELQILTDTQS